MGVAQIHTRTDDGFGVTKSNTRPIVNRSMQLVADEYNELADAVIELQGGRIRLKGVQAEGLVGRILTR